MQQQDDTCGPTSVRMVINRITGRDIPEDRVADRSHRLPGGYRNNGGPTWNPWGTNARAINEQLVRLGFDSRQGAFTTDQIVQAIKDGKQVIILHNNPSGGGHFQVVAGVEDAPNGRHVFTLNDPWTGKAYRRSELWFGQWVRKNWTTIAGPSAQP
ncbi:MAG: C39 family peptidase [Actinobacteria bacterium]|nr:C39 family peptidase [Actinomycetota bacterium]